MSTQLTVKAETILCGLFSRKISDVKTRKVWGSEVGGRKCKICFHFSLQLKSATLFFSLYVLLKGIKRDEMNINVRAVF